jgi:hypothetical protein
MTFVFMLWVSRIKIAYYTQCGLYFVYSYRKGQDIINKKGNVTRLLFLPSFNVYRFY